MRLYFLLLPMTAIANEIKKLAELFNSGIFTKSEFKLNKEKSLS